MALHIMVFLRCYYSAKHLICVTDKLHMEMVGDIGWEVLGEAEGGKIRDRENIPLFKGEENLACLRN